MRVALHHFNVEARVSERPWGGLEGDEPPSGGLGVFCNGIANGGVHSKLGDDIGDCIGRRAHLGLKGNWKM
jgi:hypothetical protein